MTKATVRTMKNTNKENKQTTELKAELEEKMYEYAKIMEEKQELENKSNEIKEIIQGNMGTLGYDKVQTEEGTFSVTAEYERTKINTKLLNKKFPSVAKLVSSTTKVKSTLKFQKTNR